MRNPTTTFTLLAVALATLVGAVRPAQAVTTTAGLVAPPPPEVSAQAWLLYDDTFGQVLAEVDADTRRSVASTTKIMTALVVLDEAETDQAVSITERAALIGESEIGLVALEAPWTIEEMLAALLLRSANDAAIALAEHVGGSVQGFAELMNAKAAELGLENSNFVNPHGLDHRDHYSSARDLLTISRAAMERPLFARLAQTLSFDLPATPEGEPRIALNRNKLLDTYPGAIGIKTGYTGNALLTLVAVAQRDGRRLYAVVLGSEDHFGDATALLDYGFGEFSALTLVPAMSDWQRPLAGAIEAPPEEDFELFITDEPEAPAVLEPPDPPEEEAPDPIDEPAPEEQSAVIARRVERRPDLPGLVDALTWVTRYVDWALGRS